MTYFRSFRHIGGQSRAVPQREASLRGSAGTMVKFLKPQKVVIILTGRYAGKKAVIVKNFDDGTQQRKYGHALVCGLSKEPRKVTKQLSKKKLERRARLKCFVKTVNYQHMMPTRYALDVDLKNVVTSESLENSSKRTSARKEAKTLMQEKFMSGKNRWFFTKLKF